MNRRRILHGNITYDPGLFDVVKTDELVKDEKHTVEFKDGRFSYGEGLWQRSELVLEQE